MYAKVLIDHVVVCNEKDKGVEQCGFRENFGCSDKVFVARKLFENMKQKIEVAFLAFMDLEKVYDKVDTDALRRVMKFYGEWEKIGQA